MKQQIFRKGWMLACLRSSCRVMAVFVVFAATVSSVRAAVAIAIEGADVAIDVALERNLRAHLGEVEEAELRNPKLLKRRIERQVTEALQALGYYHAKWSIKLLPQRVLLVFQPGPPTLLVEPQIEVIGPAGQLPIFAEIIRESRVIAGQQLDHSRYDSLKKTLMQLAHRFGFFDATYQTSELLVNISEHSAKITLILESGARYRFGSISFTGSQLSERFLLTLAPFKAGDLYRGEALATFRRQLYETGYFSQVSVTTENITDNVNHQVNILVSMEDTSQHHYKVGFGFDTDNGPRVRLNWDMPLIGPRGHVWNSKLQVSKPVQEVAATYRLPREQPLTDFLLFDVATLRQAVETTESILVNTGVSRLNLKANNWQRRYGVRTDFERYRQGDDDWNDVFYLVPHISWMRLALEKGGVPSDAHRLWLSFEGSSRVLGSDTGFFKAHIGGRWLTSLDNSPFQVLARLELGAIATDNLLEVPVSRRFYAGGDQSVRGYEYRSVASRDDEGELIGGRYLNVAGLEFTGPLVERWRGAVFVDTGRAFNDTGEPFISSVGIGARWLSLLGEVRVDLAHPLDDDSETPVRLHISMGPPL